MISLMNLPSSDDGLLARCIPRCDSGGSIVWDMDIAFSIESEEDAELVEPFVAGTVACWICAKDDGGKSKVSTTGNFDIVRATFLLDGNKLAESHAEIRQCVVATSAGVAMLTIKMRVHGLMPDSAASLAYALNDTITVELESRQVSLFASEPEPEPETEAHTLISAEALLGCVIDTEDGTGLAVSTDGQTIELDCLTGIISVDLDPEEMNTGLRVIAPPDSTLEIILEAYKAMSTKMNVDPSWADIVEAIGLLYSEGSISPKKIDGNPCWELSPDVAAKAIEVAVVSTSPVAVAEA
jgi:hypothetical protein